MSEEAPPPPPPPASDPGEPGSQPPSYPPPGFPPPTYGQPTYQPPVYQSPNYDYGQYAYPAGYGPESDHRDATSARLLVLLVVGIAVLLVVGGALIASLVLGRTSKLSHTAVEQFIATSYNADVVCNDGHDMPIETGLTYSCAGDSVAFTVRMVDGEGTYQVVPSTPQAPTADASWRSPSESE